MWHILKNRNVAHTEKQKCIQGFCRGHVNERDHAEDLGIDGRILQ
jgi:hypothetical protein